jgi:hypothetical protein
VVSVNNKYQISVLGYMAKYGPNLFAAWAAWQNSDDLLIAWQNRYLPKIKIKKSEIKKSNMKESKIKEPKIKN